MSNLNFLFFPCHNTGGHFVIWSLYYLSGQAYYEFAGKLHPVVAPADFKNAKNAHLHRCDLIQGLTQSRQLSNSTRLSDNYHAYLTTLHISSVLRDNFNTTIENSSQQQKDLSNEFILTDIKQTIDHLQDHHRFVLIDYDSDDLLNIIYNNRYPVDWNLIPMPNYDSLIQSYESTFFPNMSKQFDQHIWDRREKLALMLRIENNYNWADYVNKQKPNLIYTTDDIWNDLPNVIIELLDYLQLPLLESRFSEWKTLYWQWREKHDNHFSRNFDRILKAIVQGEYMCLKRFDLTFYKEVLIQHALITRYNLNLKTWKLEKFPSNTHDIHLLLEPNIHTL
jgi:hypothetical protein